MELPTTLPIFIIYITGDYVSSTSSLSFEKITNNNYRFYYFFVYETEEFPLS